MNANVYKGKNLLVEEALPQKIKIEENYVTNIIDYIKYFGENLSDTHSELMYKYFL
ncbi:hypothetical protein [Staphylococcus aureus]|uniref:hypothetical protein n=1 Tax=Staphylococcus aureus TaxID=1280 RepID=UPI0021CFB21F|nr:hypothetical protein [Staphylococcus aureus]UXT62719.1 hypothetical protein MUA94_00155 [Staphylococcus aureus]UXT70615.1 hypothetical protein MUA35_00160 [Staphylococcus aureus]UXU12945.1 hypothetical protein MUA59_00160 [Staphylococcus aureus]HDL0566480.1 hypothetical protein [Staphylococcus aureus]HDL0618383.1 hypothetical protein [Staphylococcus aureus]